MLSRGCVLYSAGLGHLLLGCVTLARPHHIVHLRHHLLHLHLHLLNLHSIGLRVGVVDCHVLHLHLHLLHLGHLLLLRIHLSHRHLLAHVHLVLLGLVVASHDISKGIVTLRLLLLRLGSWLLSGEAHRFESIIRLLLGWLIESHV